MRTVRIPLLVVGLGGLLLAAGCRSLGGCSNPDSYSAAQDMPRLKMPVGLDGVDTAQSMEIPPLRDAVVRPEGDSCLEEPPAMREPGSSSAPVRAEPTSKPADEPASEPAPARKPRRPVSPPR